MMNWPPERKAALFVLTAGFTLDHAVAGDRELGQYLSGECVTCHRPSRQGAQDIPHINGWPEKQFIAVLNAYKTKQRDNPVMQTIAGRLSGDEVEALAAFFGSQK